MQYTYNFKINGEIVYKTISDNSNKDFISAINYLLLTIKSSKEIYFNPNPSDKIYNCILQYNFKEISSQEKIGLVLKLKKAFESISTIDRLYLSTYQISLNNDLNLHILVKLYSKPHPKKSFDNDKLKKRLSKLKESYLRFIYKAVPEMQGKLIIKNANLFGFSDLYPSLIDKSPLYKLYNENKDYCVIYSAKIRDVMPYFELKDSKAFDFVYNFSDSEIKKVYDIAYYWYITIKRQLENNYSHEFNLYFPLKDCKKDSYFIIGIVAVPDNIVILKKMEKDFYLKKRTVNKISYIPFLDLLSKISKNYKNKRIIYDIGYLDGIFLSKDLKRINKLILEYEKKYRLKSLIDDFSKKIYVRGDYKKQNIYFLPFYKDKKFSPIKFYSKNLYSVLQIALKNNKNLIEISNTDMVYIKDEIDKRNLKKEIKIVNQFYDYAFIKDYSIHKRSKNNVLIKYPGMINEDPDIDLFNKYVTKLTNIPILFLYHLLFKIILTQNNLYLTDIILTNNFNKQNGINLMKHIYKILNINDLSNYYSSKLYKISMIDRDKNNLYFMNDTIFKHPDFNIIENIVGSNDIKLNLSQKGFIRRFQRQSNFIISTAMDNNMIRSKVINSKRDFKRYVYGFSYHKEIEIISNLPYKLKNDFVLLSTIYYMIDIALKYMKKNNLNYFDFESLNKYLINTYKLDDNIFFDKWEHYNGFN
jgi:hypothetical protein